MEDMPLVIFTILSQIVIGGFIALWWIDRKGKTNGNEVTSKSGLMISLSLLAIGGISLLVSMLHLGQPLHAYRAILNVGESWLSREILFYGLFMGLFLLYTWFWLKDDEAKRNGIGIMTAIAGILAIFSSAKIYMIPSIPAWNSVITMLLFFLTAVILGPLYVGLFLSIRKELSINIAKFLIGSLLVLAAVTVSYFSVLFGGLPEAVQTAELMINDGLFWLRMATLLLAFVLLLFSFRHKKLQNPAIYSSAFLVLLASEFFARLQFYLSAVHL